MQYSHQRYAELVNRTIDEIKRLSEQKGGEYAGDDDRLANFRRNGAALGLPMETVWAVYAGKHWDAVQQYVKDLNAGRSRMRSEPISGRLDDLIVYCLLMKAMAEEREMVKDVKPTIYPDPRIDGVGQRAMQGYPLATYKDGERIDGLPANKYAESNPA